MKLTFKQSELLKSVNISLKAVSSKTTLPILECILIDASASQIKLISNDTELGIETIVPGKIIEHGIIALEAKTFSEIIKRLPNSEISIETDEKLIAHIKCEKAKFDIPGRSGEDFTYLPIVEREASITITQFSLRQIINQTIFSIASNENNKLMTGELFEIRENMLRVVSLDGHRIAIRNLELSGNCADKRVVVPGKTLNEISRILNGGLEDHVTIYFSENHIIFEFDQTMVLSRLIDGEYFNISQMLSNDYETKIRVNKQELISCINRASLLVKESDKLPVIMNIQDNVLELSIRSEMGAMDEELSIGMEGKEIRIGLNPKFVIDVLRVIEDEEISMYFISPIAPCYIRDDHQNYTYLILPVNISR
jgi:DNA polymerase-3 subunit beta